MAAYISLIVRRFFGLPRMAQRNITGSVCWGRPSASGRQSRVSGQSGWGACSTFVLVLPLIVEPAGDELTRPGDSVFSFSLGALQNNMHQKVLLWR